MRKVEIFTAGCPVCDRVVQMVNELICENCELTTYNLVELFEDEEYLNKIQDYGVQRVPAIAINNKLLDCCQDISITKEALIEAGIGKV